MHSAGSGEDCAGGRWEEAEVGREGDGEGGGGCKEGNGEED